MKCPACKGNGILAATKPLVLFGLGVRCQLCGSDLGLGKLWSLIAKILVLAALLVSLYSAIYLSIPLLLAVVFSAVVVSMAIAMFLPMKSIHIRGMRRRRQERIKRTMQ